MSDLIGLTVDVVRFDVERGKVREFAVATHAADPVHIDPEAARAAGFDDVLATPTHVVVAGHYRDQRAFVARLGLALERVVVGTVGWQYLRPLQAGDRLEGTRTVVADEVVEGRRGGSMRVVTLQTDYVDASGQTVVRQREQLIERGAKVATS